MPEQRKDWVDFRQIRETIDFARVLESYGVSLKLRKGVQHQGFCPLPDHEGEGRSPSFSAHLGKKAFHCFGCQAQGNVLDFACRMEGWNPESSQDIRKTALLLQKRFLHAETATATPTVGQPDQPQRPKRKKGPHSVRQSQVDKEPTESKTETKVSDDRPHVINAPLNFELKGLDPTHPYLRGRGLNPETIRTFGLGYCSRGLMADRIAIPLHDFQGQLIGYAGRVIDETVVCEKNPKYRVPGPREREGAIFEINKSAFLFNSHRLRAPISDLIVVEGFFSVFHLHQNGWRNVVALMGNSCSPEQKDLIRRLTEPKGRVWLVSDGDDGGIKCAESFLMQVAPHRTVRWIDLPQGTDPCNYSAEELEKLLVGMDAENPTDEPDETDLEHIQMVSLRLVRDKTLPFPSRTLNDSEAVYEVFRQLTEDLDREALWVMCLDIRNRATCLSQVSLGTINSTSAHPREMLKLALMANSMSIILVHNHPSGDPAPTKEDKTATAIFKEAASVVGITVLDHLIVGNGAYYSFRDHGDL